MFNGGTPGAQRVQTLIDMDTAWRYEVCRVTRYEGWNFNSGNYLFTTDTK